MIKYQIRSVALINVVNDIKSKRLVSNAYFQRNLVWRDVHKREFIDTILRGYPFPQLFFSRGKINVEAMTSTSCIVDGQQRANAIMEYISNQLTVNNQTFSELDENSRANVLKYEIAVVELDLDNDDPRIKEMFKRVNRTSNSLTAIEKLASEYGATAYMVVAKILSENLRIPEDGADDVEDGLSLDPGIDDDLLTWARFKNPKNYQKIIIDGGIFSARELTRKVPLMYTLNIMSTLEAGFFNRNETSLSLLEDHKDNFTRKDVIIDLLDKSANVISKLKLPKGSIWRNKANFFSLIVAIAARGGALSNVPSSRANLVAFEHDVPENYALAAKEAVNNKKEREIRNAHVQKLLQ